MYIATLYTALWYLYVGVIVTFLNHTYCNFAIYHCSFSQAVLLCWAGPDSQVFPTHPSFHLKKEIVSFQAYFLQYFW